MGIWCHHDICGGVYNSFVKKNCEIIQIPCRKNRKSFPLFPRLKTEKKGKFVTLGMVIRKPFVKKKKKNVRWIKSFVRNVEKLSTICDLPFFFWTKLLWQSGQYLQPTIKKKKKKQWTYSNGSPKNWSIKCTSVLLYIYMWDYRMCDDFMSIEFLTICAILYRDWSKLKFGWNFKGFWTIITDSE